MASQFCECPRGSADCECEADKIFVVGLYGERPHQCQAPMIDWWGTSTPLPDNLIIVDASLHNAAASNAEGGSATTFLDGWGLGSGRPQFFFLTPGLLLVDSLDGNGVSGQFQRIVELAVPILSAIAADPCRPAGVCDGCGVLSDSAASGHTIVLDESACSAPPPPAPAAAAAGPEAPEIQMCRPDGSRCPIVLSLQPQDEWDASHVTCATRMPIHDDPSLVADVLALAGGDTSTPIVTYCKSGNVFVFELFVLPTLTDAGFTDVSNGGAWELPSDEGIAADWANDVVLEELCVCDVPAGEDGCVAAAAEPCGDTNKDGVVNVSDLLQIRKIVILSRFACCPSR